ncbi:hypothetical protein [Streptomyces sp. NPDC059256]|uniref:hypothetical protein n=1 Tax=Streptomyces sp. NPDC059256 TaxID=3346794 RepID=UPI0036AA51A7
MPDTEIVNTLCHPEHWLVYALPWPEDARDEPQAEAAVVIAPPLIAGRTLEALPDHILGVLAWTQEYADEHPDQEIIFFTDVTRWLEWEKGLSWVSLGIDWERALTDIPEEPLLLLYLTINRRAYRHLIDTARVARVYYTNRNSEILTAEERQAVRDAFATQLHADWPPYIHRSLADGSLTLD